MQLSNILNVKTHTVTAKFILYVILKCTEYENKNTILMSQTYIAKLCSTTPKTVNRELKYLQDEGYITYKRSQLETEFYATTTTEITLTDKSIAILNAEAEETTIRKQRKLSEATKAKISASMKAYWAKIPYKAE